MRTHCRIFARVLFLPARIAMVGSPPPSPALSDTFTLLDEDGLSELAGLSDVSDPSSDDDGADEAGQANAETGRPRKRTSSEGHDFEDITQSMVASAVAHVEPLCRADNSSDTAPSPSLSERRDVDELQYSVEARDTAFSTPTASTYMSSKSDDAICSANTTPMGTSLITSRDLVFPNPQSDGTSPFGLASSVHSDAFIEVEVNDTLMEMEDASIIDSTGGSVTRKRKGRKASRSVHRIPHQSRPSLSDSLFIDKKVGTSTSHVTDESRPQSGIDTPPADASSSPPAFFRKLAAGFSTSERSDTIGDAAHQKHIPARHGMRMTTLRHGQRWPTILTFGVVGIVVAWAGVTYNASNAVLSEALARQHEVKARSSAVGDAVLVPSTLPTFPAGLTIVTAPLPVDTPPIRTVAEQSSSVGHTQARSVATAAEALTKDELPPASSDSSETVLHGLATLSSVSSALSLPLRRFAQLQPEHVKPKRGEDGPGIDCLPWRSAGKRPRKGKGREITLGEGHTGLISLDRRNTQVALIALPAHRNSTCGSLSSSTRGPLRPRASRKQRWVGTQHQRKKARKLVRYLQETAIAYQDAVRPKRRVAELALKGTSPTATSEKTLPLLEGNWESLFASGAKERPAEELASPGSPPHEDQSFEQDGTPVADDLLLLPLALNQSALTVLPRVELYALLIWLRDRVDTYVSYLTSYLTLDASSRQSASNAIIDIGGWSSAMRAHAHHLHQQAQGTMRAPAEGVLAASKRIRAKWTGAQRRMRKHCIKLRERSTTNARKLAARISRKLSRHKQTYRAPWKH